MVFWEENKDYGVFSHFLKQNTRKMQIGDAGRTIVQVNKLKECRLARDCMTAAV